MKLKKTLETKQLLLLDGAIKKLVELGIAKIEKDSYVYSQGFVDTVSDITLSPLNKISQLKMGSEAGRKLIPEMLALAASKPSRRDIENLITAYVCIKQHIERSKLTVDKKLLPDLAYAVWYLNDHQPTVTEVNEWTLQA